MTFDYKQQEKLGFDQSKNMQEFLQQAFNRHTIDNDETKEGQITIFTDMNVDKHDFDIVERRKVR